PALVRRIQRVHDLPRDRQRFVERYASGPLLLESFGKRPSLDQLEHQRVDVAFVLEPVDGGDVWVVQGREDFGFALKPRESAAVRGERWRQDLDRDLTFQLRVSRPMDLA